MYEECLNSAIDYVKQVEEMVENKNTLISDAIELAKMYINEANKFKSGDDVFHALNCCVIAENLAKLIVILEEEEEGSYYSKEVRVLFDTIKADKDNPLIYRALCNSFV